MFVFGVVAWMRWCPVPLFNRSSTRGSRKVLPYCIRYKCWKDRSLVPKLSCIAAVVVCPWFLRMRIPKRVGHLVPVYVTLIDCVAMFMHWCLNEFHLIHLDFSPQAGNTYYASFIAFTAFCTIGLFNVVTGNRGMKLLDGSEGWTKGENPEIFQGCCFSPVHTNDRMQPIPMWTWYLWVSLYKLNCDMIWRKLFHHFKHDMRGYDMQWSFHNFRFQESKTSKDWSMAMYFLLRLNGLISTVGSFRKGFEL